MEGRVTVLLMISQCVMKNKCVKFETNPFRDNKVIEMLQFWVNAIWDADANANADADANAGVRTIALHILPNSQAKNSIYIACLKVIRNKRVIEAQYH